MVEPAGLHATWSGSNITELWELDTLPLPHLVACRIPPVGEIAPAPEAGKRVVSASHLM